MMITLYPTYQLRVEVKDRPPQTGQAMAGAFQASTGGSLQALGQSPSPYKWYGAFGEKTGCDDVLAAVKKALSDAGIQATVTLERFEHSS